VLGLRGPDKIRDAIDSTRQRGAAELWSDETMYKHLTFLSNTFANKNEAASRMFIETFFFRSAAMVLPDKRVVVMLAKQVTSVHPKQSAKDMVSGIIDYIALVADIKVAQDYLYIPPDLTANTSKAITAFFAAEAKTSEGTTLDGHIPQAVMELVVCAKHLEKDHIRGALTSGDRWIFLAVDLDGEGEGATYWVSEVIGWRSERISESLDWSVPVTSNRYDPALISGVLSSWMLNSFSKFNDDEWFFKR